MRVLQLFNNWKWTGPAEYAFNLTVMLNRQGIPTMLACGKPPRDAHESFFTIARDRGLPPVTEFFLAKHFDLFHQLADYRRLRRFIAREKIELIHTHMSNGHLIAALAAHRLSPAPLTIRTCYEAHGGGRRDRVLCKHFADGIIAVSDLTRANLLRSVPSCQQKTKLIPAAIDTSRFNPQCAPQDNRPQWGIAPDAPVVGIVARVQRHRRFELLLHAIAEVVRMVPQTRFMIIGRGTNIQEVAIDPVRAMGLADHVVFTGYRQDDYVATLNCLDIKVFLTPGSDESCRAVREAMALGKPVIASRRGMLPEIVEHEVTGLIVEDDPRSLAGALVQLIRNEPLRRQLGAAALKKAHSDFALDKRITQVIAFYEETLRKKTRT